MAGPVDLYTMACGSTQDAVLREVRRETYGEDLGQNSWLTADEYRECLEWLELGSTSRLLDIGCGTVAFPECHGELRVDSRQVARGAGQAARRADRARW